MSGAAPPPLPRRRDRTPAESSGDRTVFGTEAFGSALRNLPLEAITPRPDQPRRRFDQDALQALAASIAQRGLLQPIVVRPTEPGRYEIVAGERRWRAARRAGLDPIPAVVRERDDTDALQDALIENVARCDLSPVEEARCLRLLIDDLDVSKAYLARELGGRSRADVSNTLRLLALPEDVLELIDSGALSKGHGKALLAVEDAGACVALAQRAARCGWSVRELERQAASPRRGTDARAAAPTDHSDAARQLEATANARMPGSRVTATRDGVILHVHSRHLADLDALLRTLPGR